MLFEIIKALVYVSVLVFAFYLLTTDVRNQKAGVYYDCSLASFHPDIPPKVKDACHNRHVYEQDAAAIAEQQRRANPKYDPTKH